MTSPDASTFTPDPSSERRRIIAPDIYELRRAAAEEARGLANAERVEADRPNQSQH